MISSQYPHFNNNNNFNSTGNSLMGTPFSVKDILNLAEQGGQFMPMMDSQQAAFFFEDCGNFPTNTNTSYPFNNIDTNNAGILEPFAVTSGDFYSYHNNNKLADSYNNGCPDLVINSYHGHQQMTPSPVASMSQYSTSPTTTINNVPTGGSGGIPPMTSPHVQQLSHLCPPFPDVVESNDSSLTSAQDNVTSDNSAKGKVLKILFPITDNIEFVYSLIYTVLF